MPRAGENTPSGSSERMSDRCSINNYCYNYNLLGLGSVNSDERESMTLKSERAGDQLCLRISMHILPCSDIFFNGK